MYMCTVYLFLLPQHFIIYDRLCYVINFYIFLTRKNAWTRFFLFFFLPVLFDRALDQRPDMHRIAIVCVWCSGVCSFYRFASMLSTTTSHFLIGGILFFVAFAVFVVVVVPKALSYT